MRGNAQVHSVPRYLFAITEHVQGIDLFKSQVTDFITVRSVYVGRPSRTRASFLAHPSPSGWDLAWRCTSWRPYADLESLDHRP